MGLTNYICPHCGKPVTTDGLLEGCHVLHCGRGITDWWDGDEREWTLPTEAVGSGAEKFPGGGASG